MQLPREKQVLRARQTNSIHPDWLLNSAGAIERRSDLKVPSRLSAQELQLLRPYSLTYSTILQLCAMLLPRSTWPAERPGERKHQNNNNIRRADFPSFAFQCDYLSQSAQEHNSRIAIKCNCFSSSHESLGGQEEVSNGCTNILR